MASVEVMVDLETLGTTADSVILSIGAVKFDPNSNWMEDTGFYASVSVESNLEQRRQISEPTLVWWMKQTPAAQKVFHEPKQSLGEALDALTDWFGKKSLPIWSNGASFDIPMLEHAYHQFGCKTPWEFWDSRCYRTMNSMPAAKKVPKLEAKHNALTDAINQAERLQMIFKAMRNTS